MRTPARKMTSLAKAIFASAGCNDQEANCVARHLVESNLCGHDSHGVIRIPRYVASVEDGTVIPGAHAELVHDVGSLALVDGNRGFGQVIGEEVMSIIAERTRRHGIAMVAVRNSGHLGRLGAWAERLAAEQLISLHFLNTTGAGMMAVPYGGTDRRLSLNPLSICVPAGDGRPPVLLDMTTSVMSEGHLAVLRNKGENVPPGVIVDGQGNPSEDPNDFYAGGALQTIGGYKGTGLNIMIDLLAGALSGGGCTRPGVREVVNTMTTIGIDPARVDTGEALTTEINRYSAWVKGSPPRDGNCKVLFPGERARRTRMQRLRDGIPVDKATLEQILQTGTTVGLRRNVMMSMLGFGTYIR